MDYFRKDGESELAYILRLVEGKNNGVYDIDYCELFKLGFGVEFSSDHCRKMYYSLKMLLPYIEKDKTKNITSSEILTELDIKKMELQKEKEKNRTVKLELNKMLRQDARFEMFLEETKDSVDRVEPPIFKDIKIVDGKKTGIVGISDIHYGKTFKSYNNVYSIEIFEERMNVLLAEVVHWIVKNDITEVHVLNCSDNIEGLIRIDQLRSLQTGLIDSVIQFSRYMAEWLNRLSEFTHITYHHVNSANHTELRVFSTKAGQFPDEDLERIIINYIHDVLDRNERITVPMYENEFAMFKVFDKQIVACHGHQLRSVKSRDSVKHIQSLIRTNINLLVTGHLHHEENITVDCNDLGNVKIVMLPSIMGSDCYSDDLFTASCAGATLFLLEENKKGITTTEVILN